jgi:hypothetical protein
MFDILLQHLQWRELEVESRSSDVFTSVATKYFVVHSKSATRMNTKNEIFWNDVRCNPIYSLTCRPPFTPDTYLCYMLNRPKVYSDAGNNKSNNNNNNKSNVTTAYTRGIVISCTSNLYNNTFQTPGECVYIQHHSSGEFLQDKILLVLN